MITQITGLHHVTSLASDAHNNNTFFTSTLGLRRVKKTVNFDSPEVYHLYYGDRLGTPGSLITYFPFPSMRRGGRGTGEVGTTAFAIPPGSIGFWRQRLINREVSLLDESELFGERRLRFCGPDGEVFALVEVLGDDRAPWSDSEVNSDYAVRGLHSISMRVQDEEATAELLTFMGYQPLDNVEEIKRFTIGNGTSAGIIDVEILPSANKAQQGAGSVHHVAFAVADSAAQNAVRQELLDNGYQVTPVVDRDYFLAIYFRTPGGVLFEIATNEPGFNTDESVENLGEALKLPAQHEHLRAVLEDHLQPI